MERLREQLQAALAAGEDPALSAADRTDMLVEIAIDLQLRPATPEYLTAAIELYDRALALAGDRLGSARIVARRATAIQALPDGDLDAARDGFLAAIPVFAELGSPEEVAEAEMNLGLVYQTLASAHRARITDAIGAYQRALRTFDRTRYPREFAILQNNLATAFLAIPFTDERGKMREALAVQAFEEGLRIVTLVDHPAEYAMLQNNLGNALQYASSSHVLENNLRALDAYDEALKVRTRDAMPLEYANTIANKANCLWNLPDAAADNLKLARGYYGEARQIFAAHGDGDKARAAGESCDQIDRELLAAAPEQRSTP